MSQDYLSRFHRQNSPPPVTRVGEILRVLPGSPCTVCCVADEWEGYWSHWWSDCSFRCNKPNACKGCDDLLAPRRWSGFLDCCNPNGGGGAFLQLSKDGAHDLAELFGGQLNLRGRLIQIRRKRNNIRSPFVFEHVGEYSAIKPLRSAHSVVPKIAQLWKEFN